MTFPGNHLVVRETRRNNSDATQTGGVPVGAVMTVITLLGRSLSGSKLNCLLLMFEDL